MAIIMVHGNRQLKEFMNRLNNNFEPFTERCLNMITKTTAKHLKRYTFKKETGKLKSSIRPVKIGNNHYGIKMIYYGPFVDSGRKPGKRPPSGPYSKLARWAGSPRHGLYLGKHIARYGTKPTWFIYKGIETAEPEWQGNIQHHLDYYFKSGGRTL